MNLLQIKTIFSERLSTIYPKNEIDSIFNILVHHMLNYSKIEIHQNLSLNVASEIEIKMVGILERLAHNEPIQYITGVTEFYNLTLKTDKRALIPRQETEYLVDIILKEILKNKKYKIIDLCTGSGCIALALASNLPQSQIIATDISKDALELAAHNAKENKLPIKFICDSILEPQYSFESYDVIVSNPPYVRKEEKKQMHQNILKFEPASALFVPDSDPLIFYRAIAAFGNKYLIPGGTIYCEINEAFGSETHELFKKAGYIKSNILKDLNNKDRFIKASKE
jgi:release factor glutamine methyltransferase